MGEHSWPLAVSDYRTGELGDVAGVTDGPQERSETVWKDRISLELAVNQSFSLLNQTQAAIDRQINLPIRILGVEKKPVRTFQDWSREGRLLTPYVGIGYNVNDVWTMGLRGGYSRGREKNDRLLLLGPLKADFEYSALFLEIYGSYYPVGKPDLPSEAKRGHVFRDGRPVLWQAISATRFVQQADVRFHLGPFPVFNKSVRHDDWVGAYHLGLGWEWPITAHWNAQIIGNYSFYFDRPTEFNGFGTNLLFMYRF